MEDNSGLPDDLETLQMILEEADAKILSLQGRIAQEENKMERYKVYKKWPLKLYNWRIRNCSYQ